MTNKSRQITGGLGSLITGSGGVQSPAARAAVERRTSKAAPAISVVPDEPTPPAPAVTPDPAVAPEQAVAESPARVDDEATPAAATATAAPEPTRAPAAVKRTSPTRRRRTASHPRFDELERKEARLRQDQLDDLAAVSRRLQKSKPKGMGGERITDNTLIRVAVDLLLEHADQLTGHSEQEIVESALKNAYQGET